MKFIGEITKKMTFRKVRQNEAAQIAALHARSWQIAYKGILSDSFLENEVFDERLKVWQNRFATPEDNRCIFVAVDDGVICGFICIYGNDDAQWGSLIDNLHISPDFKGKGIGKRLMNEAKKWIFETHQTTYFHLWVYENNHAARQFYEKLGGENVESENHQGLDGTWANALRYVWR